MKRRHRGATLWNVPLAPRPGEQDAVKRLEEDLQSSPVRGHELRLRLRNFRPSQGAYLLSLGGPLPYMLRIREIADGTDAHLAALTSAHRELAAETTDADERQRRWREIVRSWNFDAVNDLIDRHNRWYPIEARLPMDPRSGDFALVNGKSYRLEHLDADWALDRVPGDPTAG